MADPVPMHEHPFHRFEEMAQEIAADSRKKAKANKEPDWHEPAGEKAPRGTDS